MGRRSKSPRTETEPQPQAPGCRLEGAYGGAAFSFLVPSGESVVGFLAGSDLPLPVRGVSRRHARLHWEGGELWVSDLASKNGTYVNGLRVQATVLRPGDQVRFGPVPLEVKHLDPGDATVAITSEEPSPASAAELTDLVLQDDSALDRGWTLLRHLAHRFFDGQPVDLLTALRLLGAHLEAEAGLLGEWPGGGMPRMLAAFGDLGADALAGSALGDWLAEAFAAGEAAPACRPGLLGADVVLTGLRRPGSDLLFLLLRRGRAEPALYALAGEVFLRLVGEVRSRRPERDRPRQAGDGGSLAAAPGFVRGVSPAMEAVYRQIEQLRRADFPVLVVGETGVGKELLVRLLHESSERRGRSLVAVNCAAIPAELLEAEMFGIGRGVATGVEPRQGKFQQADGGSLFLDEVGEMPSRLQAKLLRALESGSIDPVGGGTVEVDVRILAATNADLEARVEAGQFRADLYYRLSGCRIVVPPLRQRREDIPLLAQHFLNHACRQAGKRVAGLTLKALEDLAAYGWPGNVRQLGNEVRRLVFACPEGQAIDSTMLAPALRAAGLLPPQPAAGGDLDLGRHVAALERRLIGEALAAARGNRTEAARRLGLSRAGLTKKMARLRIEVRAVVGEAVRPREAIAASRAGRATD